MKVAIFGASGSIGRCIVEEALVRGHEVTAIIRNSSRFNLKHPRLHVLHGDIRDAEIVFRAVLGHDAAISAIGPTRGEAAGIVVQAAASLLEGLKQANVRRLIIVGGAGSLEIEPGLNLMDSPNFPIAWKPIAQAHSHALELYRQSDLDWTFLSPAALIQPGRRTGKYRTGKDQLLITPSGESQISIEDYAVALIDELEHPKHNRQRFTVAY